MLVKIDRSTFDSLDNISLIWKCIEPTIQPIRGKSFAVKAEASTHLTPGQRALLMFQMLYGHSANGIIELFSHLSYLFSQKGVWSLLKKGIQYFGDMEMLHLLEKIEEVYNEVSGIGNENQEVAGFAGLDNVIQSKVSVLNQQFFERMPATINFVGSYIRNHTEEFLQIDS